MNYVIFDLEWNNAYNYKTKKPINEIIEVGAVKLDRNLNVIDTFKQLIKPKITKKLSSRCKNLTNITNDEINNFGLPFEDVMADFSRWSGGENSIFMSWSNSDLYVLAENFRSILNSTHAEFLKYYCDAQQYCMSYIDNTDNNQISLSNCAELFNIDIDKSKLHRALADCYVTAECFKKVYNKNDISKFVKECDFEFFNRLLYKPYYITIPNGDLFKLSSVDVLCPDCGTKLKMLKKYELVNNSFKNVGFCNNCSKKFWLYVRAKKTYDDVVVSTHIVAMNKKKAHKDLSKL